MYLFSFTFDLIISHHFWPVIQIHICSTYGKGMLQYLSLLSSYHMSATVLCFRYCIKAIEV